MAAIRKTNRAADPVIPSQKRRLPRRPQSWRSSWLPGSEVGLGR
jgi:hypothetical protein